MLRLGPLTAASALLNFLFVVGIQVVANEEGTTRLDQTVHISEGPLGVLVAVQVNEHPKAIHQIEGLLWQMSKGLLLTNVALPVGRSRDSPFGHLQEAWCQVHCICLIDGIDFYINIYKSQSKRKQISRGRMMKGRVPRDHQDYDDTSNPRQHLPHNQPQAHVHSGVASPLSPR